MKIFEYSYGIRYGAGCGIVIAKTKELAIEMVMKNPYSEPVEDLELKEIDKSVSQVIDHSWCE
jgi:hypothetical protein